MIVLLVLSGLFSFSLQTTLIRRDLGSYDLARCNDGTPAAYFYQQDVRYAGQDVVIYLPDGGECDSVEGCRDRCREGAQGRSSCTAPDQQVLDRRDGIWSSNPLINPFADHFKVYLHYCTSDNYAGTRGASRSTGNFYFHGKHVVTAMLEDLSSKFGLEGARSLSLVGTGSGARGVGYNCDYVASLLPSVRVKCIADSPDMVPWWIKTDDCDRRDYEKEEGVKNLWGRQEDESCIEKNKAEVNSSELAHRCGVWSRYRAHIDTPFFLVGSQFDPNSIAENPCFPDESDPDYEEYELAWRRGIAALYESILAGREDRSWFVPDCRTHGYLDGDLADSRLGKLTVPMIENNKTTMSLGKALSAWLAESAQLHAIDRVAGGNLGCPGPAPLCRGRSSCSGATRRSYASYPSVRRSFQPPSYLFPRGYNRRSYIDPWLGSGYGTSLSRGYGINRAASTAGSHDGGYGTSVGGGGHGSSRGAATSGRRSRLWKRLVYLQYLRRLYKKHKTNYAREYYGSYDYDTDFLYGSRTPDFGLGGRGLGGVRPGLTGLGGARPGLTDLLGDDYYDDYYDDYATGTGARGAGCNLCTSGLINRLKSAIRLKKGKTDDNTEKKNIKEEESFDYEDFGPLTEEIETSTK